MAGEEKPRGSLGVIFTIVAVVLLAGIFILKLTENGLDVSYNEIGFTKANVRALTAIGESTKKLILSGLSFDGRSVHEIMTPKSVVDTIQNTEMLGPLVLDDLHKTGHSRFPVVDGDIDHVVGVLYVHDVLTLDTSKKHTSKVETAMSKKVYYIREDHSLGQALTAFLSTHHHLFIVINEFRETVGIVTLEDTLEALLGRRIIDEFDAHDDMRAVAARNAAKKSVHSRMLDFKDV